MLFAMMTPIFLAAALTGHASKQILTQMARVAAHLLLLLNTALAAFALQLPQPATRVLEDVCIAAKSACTMAEEAIAVQVETATLNAMRTISYAFALLSTSDADCRLCCAAA